jgi:molybdenum cofactor cytidylyltransferase
MIERNQFAAIVTAAGESSRMGTQKALVKFNGPPLIDHQIACLKGFGQLIVVTGHEGKALHEHVGRSLCVYNTNHREGRSSSIEVGAQALRDDLQGVLIVGVDQPLVPEIVSEILLAFDGETELAAVPVVDGRRGHPVLCSATLFDELKRCSEVEEGLRGLLLRFQHALREVPIMDERILVDLNSPEELQAAERGWA